jgi:hypothetical protein
MIEEVKVFLPAFQEMMASVAMEKPGFFPWADEQTRGQYAFNYSDFKWDLFQLSSKP